MTLDSSVLGSCDKVLITASTLLNDTLDQVLAQCKKSAKIALVGPTASGFSEPFSSVASVCSGVIACSMQNRYCSG